MRLLGRPPRDGDQSCAKAVELTRSGAQYREAATLPLKVMVESFHVRPGRAADPRNPHRDMPATAAIERVDQCVSSPDLSSRHVGDHPLRQGRRRSCKAGPGPGSLVQTAQKPQPPIWHRGRRDPRVRGTPAIVRFRRTRTRFEPATPAPKLSSRRDRIGQHPCSSSDTPPDHARPRHRPCLPSNREIPLRTPGPDPVECGRASFRPEFGHLGLGRWAAVL
jgi:hypothetical protein